MGGVGRDGLTHNMLDNIHAHWKRRRVCKIKCKGVCTVDMENVCQQLEVSYCSFEFVFMSVQCSLIQLSVYDFTVCVFQLFLGCFDFSVSDSLYLDYII